MKFLVVVNGKYMVDVEANTHGGAEHIILDDFHYGIEQCQAFSMKELHTDTFKHFAEGCETIGREQLMLKCEKYKHFLDEKTNEEFKVSDYTEQISRIERELKSLKDNKITCLCNIETLKRNMATAL